MKLLMATDGSSDATAALTAAARVFRHDGLEADLLSVVPPLAFPGAEGRKTRSGLLDRVRETYAAGMRQEADRVLAVAMELLRSEALDARPRTEEGSVVEGILGLSRNYDVVAVGAHDRFGRTLPGVGPVGIQVMSQSEVSVLIGREPVRKPLSRVLVPVDGSEASTLALRRLGNWIHLDEARVDILHVVELPWVRFGLEPDWLGETSGLEEDDRERLDGLLSREADRVVEEARRELELQGLSPKPVVRDGLPEAQILSEAEVGEYDLIVMGATGRSHPAGARLGSVAVRVAANAPASVWIVR